MWKDFKLGIKCYRDALSFIKMHNFWIYFIFPVILFICIYYIGFYFKDLTKVYKTPHDAGFFLSVWYYFVSGIFLIISYMFLNFIRYVIIILMSPLLSIVSERTERILTGNSYQFNLIQLIKDIKRALNLAVRNLIWELSIGLLIIITISITTWIFGINETISYFIRTIFITIIAFYYYGFVFIDYIMERLRLNIKESVKFVRKHKGFAIALGAIFTPLFHYTNKYLIYLKENVEENGILFLTILILSAILMAVIPIISMVAATLGVNELVDLKNNPFSKSSEKQVP